MKEKYDVIIIGSGIAGMTAALYLKRGGLEPLIIEESAPGGQLNKINIIENYPGFLKTDGPTLAMEIYNQVEKLGIKYLYDKVIKVDLTNEEKEVTTGNRTLYCKFLVIATGRLSKKLFNDDDRHIGKGISYCALCDGNLYKDKVVGVVGAGNSALESALYLSNISKKIYLFVRSDAIRGDKILREQIEKTDNIEIKYNTFINELVVNSNEIIGVKTNNDDYNLNGLFINIGYEPSINIVKNLDIKLDRNYILVDKNMETNLKGIYACGDIIKKDLYQLVTAVSDGAIAANHIYKNIKK